jgi:hypothetical protein
MVSGFLQTGGHSAQPRYLLRSGQSGKRADFFRVFRILVDRFPGYRSRGPGSIPGATTFSDKQWVWNGVHSAS